MTIAKKSTKNAQLDTTTLRINFNNSDFTKLRTHFQIWEYDLPRYCRFFRQEDYARGHIWLRSQTDQPYYFHFKKLKLYLAYERDDKVESLERDNKELAKREIVDFENPSLYAPIIKLLTACYVHLEEPFISNNKFYLLYNSFTSKRENEYAEVLKITPQLKAELNVSNTHTGSYELRISNTATRLKKTTYANRNRQQIPFALDETRDEQLVFRPLKMTDDIAEAYEIYEENTDKNYRTKIKNHSLESVAEFERSRIAKLQKFTEQLLSFLTKIGLQAERKILNIIQVANKLEKDILNLAAIKVSVLDFRFNREVSIEQIIDNFNTYDYGKIFTKTILEKVTPQDNVLILMDYTEGDCTRFGVLSDREKEDGYRIVKRKGIVNSQGFCININAFKKQKSKLSETEFLTYQPFNRGNLNDTLSRGLQISLEQLYLKRIVTDTVNHQAVRLPRVEILENSVFIHCFSKKNQPRFQHFSYVRNGELIITDFKDAQIPSILKSFGFNDLHELVGLRQQYNPHNEFHKGEIFLMLNADFFAEIRLINERLLYSNELGNILRERAKIRTNNHFLLPVKNDFFTSEQTQQYNYFIKQSVPDKISYEALMYGTKKGIYRPTINEILGITNENRLAKALGFRGKRGSGLLTTYQGVWFDKNRMQYFVGENNSYQQRQEKGFRLRKIVVYRGEFKQDYFFPLLNVDFVKHKSYTVLPYVFRLLKIYSEMR